MSGLFPALDPLTRNHVVIAEAGPDHRVDARVAVNYYFEKRGPLEFHEFVDYCRQVILVFQTLRELEAVSFRCFDEVLAVQ